MKRKAMKRNARTIPISGVWLRTGIGGRLEVLVEVDCRWRLLRGNGEVYEHGMISHIWEPLGISRATPDPLDDEVAR